MIVTQLESTARALVSSGRGILAADESRLPLMSLPVPIAGAGCAWPACSTREEAANVRCAVGSCDGRRPSLGGYVTGMGATSGATASGGR
jgi:hypothetical protein